MPRASTLPIRRNVECPTCGSILTRSRGGGGPKGEGGRLKGATGSTSAFNGGAHNPVDDSRGRWPANVVLTDPIFDGDTPGVVGGGCADGATSNSHPATDIGFTRGGFGVPLTEGYGDTGTYSRFFLIPKEARAGREPAVRGSLAERDSMKWSGGSEKMQGVAGAYPDGSPRPSQHRENVHPTVKPLELMRHLVRLVTPPGGLVLDPFLGSGTTALAAINEGFRCIGIEREAEYVAITMARLHGTQTGMGLDVPAPTTQRSNKDGVAVRRNIGISKRGMFGIGTDEPQPDMTYARPKPPAEPKLIADTDELGL